MQLTLDEIRERVGGRLLGDPDRVVTGIATLRDAGPDDLTFVANAALMSQLDPSTAGAAIVPEGSGVEDRDVIEHENPYAAVALLIEEFHPQELPEPGVSPLAAVHPDADVDRTATIGPFAVVAADARIAAGAVVGAGTYVGERCEVGEGTVLHPRVVLYADTRLGAGCIVHSGVVLGSDGFGFTRVDGQHRKIPQVGGVLVGDDVEIGSNTCVDRGTLGDTVIGRNSKIDNLVQVGHNCRIGERVILCGMSGFAGSTVIEDDVVFGARSGASGHLTVGAGSMAAAGAGVMGDVEPGSLVAGVPAVPLDRWRRAQLVADRLPEMRRELRALRKRVARLERELED